MSSGWVKDSLKPAISRVLFKVSGMKGAERENMRLRRSEIWGHVRVK